MKSYIINVITHKMTTHTFNRESSLLEFIERLDISQSFKKTLIENGHVHVPSKVRSNSLDVYVINVVNEYLEELHLSRVKYNKLQTDYALSLDRMKEGLDKVNDGFKNQNEIADLRVLSVLGSFYYTKLKLMVDNNMDYDIVATMNKAEEEFKKFLSPNDLKNYLTMLEGFKNAN